MSALSARKARLAAAGNGMASRAGVSLSPHTNRQVQTASAGQQSINEKSHTQDVAGEEDLLRDHSASHRRDLRLHDKRHDRLPHTIAGAIGPDALLESEDDDGASTLYKRARTAHIVGRHGSAKQEADSANAAPSSFSHDGNASSADSILQRQVIASTAPSPAYCTSLPALLKGKYKAGKYDGLICRVRCGETLALVGTYSITVLAGSISIAGTRLDQRHSKTLVFAPRSQGLSVIRASDDVIQAKNDFDLDLPPGEHGAVVHIQDLDTKDIQELGLACHLLRPDAFSLSSESRSIDWVLRQSQPVLAPTRGIFAAVSLPSWLAALDRLPVERATYAVRGPKRTGKSTFCRMLLSRLQTNKTNRVCYLETDVGQPDFGPPGVVALHVLDSSLRATGQDHSLAIGPGWTCFREPARAHFIGDVSPRNDPRGYMGAIADLLTLYRDTYAPKGASLVVNTQGWIKGMGADLLSEIEHLAKPDYDFVMQGEQDVAQGLYEPDNLAQSATLEHVTLLEGAPASVTRERAMNASDARALTLTSYFYATDMARHVDDGAITDASPQMPSWDFSQSLVEQPPYILDVATGLQGGIHISTAAAAIPPEMQLMALNASIVALVLTAGDDTSFDETSNTHDVWMRALQEKRPNPSKSTCLGLAIVRAIDVEAREIHLLTPIASDTIATAMRHYRERGDEHEPVLALVKGEMELPVWLSLDQDLLRSNAPSNTGQIWTGAGYRGRSGAGEPSLAGVPLHAVPYLDFGDDMQRNGPADGVDSDGNATGANALSLSKRRIRRNLLRPSQHRA